MNHSWLLKGVAVGVTVLAMAVVLARIGFLVDERQAYQRQAVASVQQSHAGAQALLGPILQRSCSEEWQVAVGEGASRRLETQRREFTRSLVPSQLEVQGRTEAEARYRGLFKVNGYLARLQLQARWADLEALKPVREQAGSRLSCKPATLWLAASDVRGLRSATLQLEGAALSVQPGTGNDAHPNGLRAELPGFAGDGSVPAGPLAAAIELQLVGTAQLALVPAAQSTQWALRSDWPHPSFGGRFLPVQREVNEQGFNAQWSVSALATAAARDALAGTPICQAPPSLAGDETIALPAAAPGGKACLDTFAVSFIDPVNPYTLSDRAIKYGLLFVLLTFAAVALVETLSAGRVRRVHPVQYALVGMALCLFFLLLLSLSEHLPFVAAYTVASAAVVGLLALYARHMLGSARGGWLFGGAAALLYGLLYVLLLREQTALLIGSLGLFVALAAVMLLTRRLDWYGLARTPARAAATAD
jgi:inner membrane protein